MKRLEKCWNMLNRSVLYICHISQIKNPFSIFPSIIALFFCREFGLTLLCLMISSSFQITICVYSIVLESLGKNVNKNNRERERKTITEPINSITNCFQDAVFLISQVFWLFSHVVRIFVIVEPCHLVAFEVNRFIK